MAAPGAGLSYQWQMNGLDIPGATNDSLDINTDGSYTVAVSNIGCSSISSVTTISAGPLNVNLGLDTSFCESKPLILDAGYAGAHYLWSTGDTTKTITIYDRSGDYSVVVDGGINCKDADTINVQIDPLPSVVGISYIRMNTSTFQFSPSGPQDVNNYTWIFGDGTVDFTMSPTHTYAANDPWEVTLVVANDCGFDTSQLDLRSLSVTDVNDISSHLILYPNPAKDLLNIKTDVDAVIERITIVNNIGQVVYAAENTKGKAKTIDIGNLSAGNYILKAYMSNGKLAVKKFNILK